MRVANTHCLTPTFGYLYINYQIIYFKYTYSWYSFWEVGFKCDEKKWNDGSKIVGLKCTYMYSRMIYYLFYKVFLLLISLLFLCSWIGNEKLYSFKYTSRSKLRGGRTLCVVLCAKKIVTPACFNRSSWFLYNKKACLFCFLTIPKTWRQLITELRGSALVAYRYIFARLTSPISHPWYPTVTIYETIRIPQATDTEHQEMFLYTPNFFTTSKFWTKPYYTLHLPLHGKNKNSSIFYIQITELKKSF